MKDLNGVNGDDLVLGGENNEIGVYAGKTISINNNFTIVVNGTDLVIGGINNDGTIITTPPPFVYTPTFKITPGHTVNLGSAGSPTDLSNGEVAFVRIDQPTLVTDGRDMSFVATPDNFPVSITVPANHEVSSLGDAANADDNSLGNVVGL